MSAETPFDINRAYDLARHLGGNVEALASYLLLQEHRFAQLQARLDELRRLNPSR
jgi:hypothetical protein